MADDFLRSPRPATDVPAAVKGLVELWSAMAEVAADVAHAKRAISLAYVAEGFTEPQAIELLKSI